MIAHLLRSLFSWPFDFEKWCCLCKREDKSLISLSWLFEDIFRIIDARLLGTPHRNGVHKYKFCDDCISRQARAYFELMVRK